MNAPIKVLLVEDNPGDARLIQEMLADAANARFTLVHADRLSAALETLADAEVDVVLLDLSLPDSHGLDTFAKVQAAAAALPIIVFTGLDDEELGTRTVHGGAQDYLVKGQVDSNLLVRSMRYAIERKKVQKQLAAYTEQLQEKNAEMESELRMAREIQQAFLPQHYPTLPRGAQPRASALRFCHHYQPTATLAGDFFDIIDVSDTQAGVFICDVMGHGVRAALVTAFLRGLVEELKPVAADPGRFLTEIDRSFLAILKRSDTFMFASAFYVVADLAAGQLLYANAGHPEPMHVCRSRGIVKRLEEDGDKPQPALGLVEEFVHVTHRCPLETQDLVLLFTDGVFEVMDPEGRQFGEERLLASVRRRIHLPPEAMFTDLLAEINTFSTSSEFPDDVCLVGMEVTRARLEED